jgi:hypothetical protein
MNGISGADTDEITERQIADLSTSTIQGGGSAGPGLSHSPAQNSPLASPPATFTSQETPALPAAVEPGAKVD